MKVLIFDSGPLINLSINGLLDIIEDLRKGFDGKFIITEEVKREVIDKPMGIQRFELGAIRIQNLLERKIIELPSSIGIDKEKIKLEGRKLMDIANHSMKIQDKPINIVSEAEMSCVALSSELNKKGIKNIIAVDERTTRILAEDAENLERIMSDKLNQKIKVDTKTLKIFENHYFIRSSEIVYVAFKKGLIDLTGGRKVLDALIYATKFKGSAISFEEINELKKLQFQT